VEAPASRRIGVVLCGLLLTGTVGACTSGSPAPAKRSQPSPASTASTPTPASAPSAPMVVQVTHVAGRLPERQRHAVTVGVRRTLASYVDGAFLAGPYPRTDFRAAFGAFTRGAVPAARRDLALLTDRPLGSTTTGVRALHRTAYLSVLSPHGKVAGVTAAVDLVLAVDRGHDPGRRLHMKGRLLLTRDAKGRWAVFGYDLARSQTAAGSGS